MQRALELLASYSAAANPEVVAALESATDAVASVDSAEPGEDTNDRLRVANRAVNHLINELYREAVAEFLAAIVAVNSKYDAKQAQIKESLKQEIQLMEGLIVTYPNIYERAETLADPSARSVESETSADTESPADPSAPSVPDVVSIREAAQAELINRARLSKEEYLRTSDALVAGCRATCNTHFANMTVILNTLKDAQQ